MNQAEFVEDVQKRLGGSKGEAIVAIRHVTEALKDAVHNGDKVSISGFGIFERRTQSARNARNPRTGETVAVPERVAPRFRPAIKFVASTRAAHASGDGSAPA